jgi:putative ABC transport system substrate-binding protein
VISPSELTIERFRNVVVPELSRLGFIEGINLAVTAHVGLPARMPELAREALATRPEVVVATSLVAIRAVKAASSILPIVMSFIGEDPVAMGLAQTLGSTATGILMLATEMGGKRPVLLHEAVPSARRIAILAGRPPWQVNNVREMRRIASVLRALSPRVPC